MAIRIIPLEPQHREPIRTILQATNFFRDDEIDVAIELLDANLNRTDDYQVYVAAGEAGKVLGYVCFGKIPITQSSFDLYWIAVDPNAQKGGIGKQLFEFTCNEVSQQGGKLIVIETASQPKYIPTQRFYERIGCTLEARLKNFYSIGDDKLIYTKHL
ncbi:MAG: GNAT family N-acetyltransferase [Rhizobacter sp.]|nr:GNAT family N-acetyltransferase [Chlorobiales bacterium]